MKKAGLAVLLCATVIAGEPTFSGIASAAPASRGAPPAANPHPRKVVNQTPPPLRSGRHSPHDTPTPPFDPSSLFPSLGLQVFAYMNGSTTPVFGFTGAQTGAPPSERRSTNHSAATPDGTSAASQQLISAASHTASHSTPVELSFLDSTTTDMWAHSHTNNAPFDPSNDYVVFIGNESCVSSTTCYGFGFEFPTVASGGSSGFIPSYEMFATFDSGKSWTPTSSQPVGLPEPITGGGGVFTPVIAGVIACTNTVSCAVLIFRVNPGRNR